MALPMRQIHLDFHTSEHIPEVGADFDPKAFAQTLKRAHVNSVTLFSRCHHGWIYHDTRFTELRHPNLQCDLLALQMEACAAEGIATPVYITVGWDERAAREHPEWREHHPDHGLVGPGPLGAGWRTLCFNTPYLDFVEEQTDEVMERFNPVGIFFDIMFQGECCCPWCLAGMAAEHIDPANPPARAAYAARVLKEAKRRLHAVVTRRNPKARVFFNAGHVDPQIRDTLHLYTHLELESLPSGGWGYMHFPTTVRYARKLGLDCLAMTGKFHVTWGHFNSFKHPAALEYETLVGPAHCAAISIGDQLHPRGRLCEETYERIGRVFGLVEEREPWYEGAQPVSEIAVFHTEACAPTPGFALEPSAAAATRILMEGAYQFDLVDAEMDWSGYAVLVLPDKVVCTPALEERIRAFLANGGKVLATYRSGLSQSTGRFELSEWPVDLVGEAPIYPDFIEVSPILGHRMPKAPFVAYERGLETAPRGQAEILADTWLPYFERTYAHFCSHAHAPVDRRASYPSAVRKDGVIYLSHPHFAAYGRHGAFEDAQIVRNALNLLLPEPLVLTSAPSTCQVHLTRQPHWGRWVVHVLHYIPERRSADREMIQDVIPLSDVELQVRTPRPPSRCLLAPGGEEVPWTQEGSYVRLRLPVVRGHALVVLESVE